MKVYFYYPGYSKIDPCSHVATDSLDHWIFETYRNLSPAQGQIEISIGDSIPQEGIIVFMARHFPKNIMPGSKQFFVCVQADKGRYPFAQWHIVHNPFQTSFLYTPSVVLNDCLDFTKTVCLDPWPISNMKNRNVDRGSEVSNLSFHGNVSNLPKSIQSSYFKSFIQERGMSFRVYDQPSNWNDFSTTDLSFCMRDFEGKKHLTKPYLKITNSLLADVPIVAGMDSSSEYFRKHYLNIPLLKSQQQLQTYLDNVSKGLINPFLQLEEFANIKGQFTRDGVIIQWKTLLNKIGRDYDKWAESGSMSRKMFFKMRSLLQTASISS